MSQDTPQDHVTKKRVVYEMPGADRVTIRRDVEFRAADASVLAMDLYYPCDSKRGARLPAVVVVAGYSDLEKLKDDSLNPKPLFTKDTLADPGNVRPGQAASTVHVHPGR